MKPRNDLRGSEALKCTSGPQNQKHDGNPSHVQSAGRRANSLTPCRSVWKWGATGTKLGSVGTISWLRFVAHGSSVRKPTPADSARNPFGHDNHSMQLSDVSIPVSIRLPRAERERLLAMIATGQRHFVLASADGVVSQRVVIVADHRAPRNETEPLLGDARIDWERGTIERGNRRVSLSITERRLLTCLIDDTGSDRSQPVSRDRLIAAIWPSQAEQDSRNSLAVYVCYLRQKLAAVGLGDTLQTVRGVGYRLVAARAVRSKSA